MLTASASHRLTHHLFFTFFPGRVLCSTVDVVRKTQNLAGPARAAALSRERDEGHHRPVMASAPDRRNSPSPPLTRRGVRASQSTRDRCSTGRRAELATASKAAAAACVRATEGRPQWRPRRAAAARSADGAAQGSGRVGNRSAQHALVPGPMLTKAPSLPRRP